MKLSVCPCLKYFSGFLQMVTKLSQVQPDFPRDFMTLRPWKLVKHDRTLHFLVPTYGLCVKSLILCDLLSYLGRE